MQIKINISLKDLKVNRIVKYFIASDLLLLGGWGLVAPVFSIFIIEKVKEATLLTVGLTAAIYWIIKSLVQLPVAIHLDKNPGEKDDFYILISSLILSGFSAMAFTLVKTVGWLYLVQFIYAISFGLYTPSWSGIFSRHLDKDHYAFDWSLDSTTVGLTSGLTGLVGGIFANYFGFKIIFVFISLLSFISALILLLVPDLILPRKSKISEPLIKDHIPLNINK